MFQSHVIKNRAMKRLVFLVVHGPKVWNSVIRLCIFQCQFLSYAVFIKFKSQNVTTTPFLIFYFYNSKSITLIENIKSIASSRRFSVY